MLRPCKPRKPGRHAGAARPNAILRTKTALKDIPAGVTLEVPVTDPGSAACFGAFCRTTCNAKMEYPAAGGVYRFVIRHTA